jgi:hypothetical protein
MLVDDGLLRQSAGYVSFDELVKTVVVEHRELDPEFIEERIEILKKINIVDKIVRKYLTSRERIIFKLIIDLNKRVSDVMFILKYNNFQSAENNIHRVFKLIKTYLKYEMLDKDDLYIQINLYFNSFERQILKKLHNRQTVAEIRDCFDEISYKKMNLISKEIIDKLECIGGICKEYRDFLVSLRKFRHIGDEDIE